MVHWWSVLGCSCGLSKLRDGPHDWVCVFEHLQCMWMDMPTVYVERAHVKWRLCVSVLVALMFQ